MPPMVELIVIVVTMLAAFFLMFLLVYLLALLLSPIERSLSKMIWNMHAPPPPLITKKGSFKDFSRKH